MRSIPVIAAPAAGRLAQGGAQKGGRGAARGAGAPQAALSMRSYLLILAAAMMLPALALAGLQGYESANARQAEAKARMQAVALMRSNEVERGLVEMTATARVLALSPSLRRGNLAGFRRVADEVAAERHVSIVLRDPSGAQLVATRVAAEAALPTLPPEDPAARRALDAGLTYVSGLFTTSMIEPFMARVVVPAEFGTGGDVHSGYAVEVAFPPKTVAGWLSNNHLPPDWLVVVSDQSGLVVASSSNLEGYAGRGSGLDDFAPRTQDVADWRGTALDGTRLYGAYAHLSASGWNVAVGATSAVLSSGMRLSLEWLGLAGLAMVLGGIALSARLARQIERGAAMVARAAQQLGAGEAIDITAPSVREFAVVGTALQAAAEESARRYLLEQQLLGEIRNSRDLLQAVVDGTADPIFARDLDGRFVLVNAAGMGALGLTAPLPPVGRRVGDMQLPDEARRMLATLEAAASAGEPVAISSGRPGDSRLFQVNLSPWWDREGDAAGIVCVAHDVTDRTRAGQRMQVLQADLARAGRLSAVAAMAAGLAHELNQPLSAASNYLAAASGLMTLQNEGPAVQESMAEAAEQVLRAGEIVRRLRNFLGDEQADMTIQVLAPLVEEAARAAWRHAADWRSHLNLDLDAAVTALVDPVQIQLVVSNLVRNAAQAMSTAAVLERREVWVRLAQTGDGGCAVSVIDTGPGFDSTRRDRLFDVFGGSGKPGGMGVGLAICDTIVAAHGGVLLAGDTETCGAAFTFTLPAVMPSVIGQVEPQSQYAA